MTIHGRSMILSMMVLVAALLPAGAAQAALTWAWSYTGAGVDAGGTFTTTDAANGDGYYEITGITGQRNGDVIVGLQPAGTPIPGNEPFVVDNLVRVSGTLLTVEGFGYATAAGNYANPFYADFLPTPGYLEFFSAPPFTSPPGPEDSELPVIFQASVVAVPEPGTALLALAGLAGIGLLARGRGARKAS
jgi:hypothetical protein